MINEARTNVKETVTSLGHSCVNGQPCRLCRSAGPHHHFSEDARRPYYQCSVCKLVFVPDAFVLSAEAERAEYDKHENVLGDVGYLRFLDRAVAPIRAWVTPPIVVDGPLVHHGGLLLPRGAMVHALDFGCGPGPALAEMLRREFLWDVDLFDKYYFPNPDTMDLGCRAEYYRCITATEVVEHLADAGAVLAQLWRLLLTPPSTTPLPSDDTIHHTQQQLPPSLLVIMTKRVVSRDRFHTWHYKNDPTHITFFSDETFEWIAKSRFLLDDGATTGRSSSVRLRVVSADVVLLEKYADDLPSDYVHPV